MTIWPPLSHVPTRRTGANPLDAFTETAGTVGVSLVGLVGDAPVVTCRGAEAGAGAGVGIEPCNNDMTDGPTTFLGAGDAIATAGAPPFVPETGAPFPAVELAVDAEADAAGVTFLAGAPTAADEGFVTVAAGLLPAAGADDFGWPLAGAPPPVAGLPVVVAGDGVGF
jgi:hypothetical protein